MQAARKLRSDPVQIEYGPDVIIQLAKQMQLSYISKELVMRTYDGGRAGKVVIYPTSFWGNELYFERGVNFGRDEISETEEILIRPGIVHTIEDEFRRRDIRSCDSIVEAFAIIASDRSYGMTKTCFIPILSTAQVFIVWHDYLNRRVADLVNLGELPRRWNRNSLVFGCERE